MPWLVKEGKVLASVELARSRRQRLRHVDAEEPVTGVLLIEPARAAHTLRSDRPIDIAFLGQVDPEGDPQPEPDVSPPIRTSAATGPAEVGKAMGKEVLGRARTVGKALSTSRGDRQTPEPIEEADYRVLRVATLSPNRIVKPELRAVAAIEAEAGSFERWGLLAGDTVSIELRE